MKLLKCAICGNIVEMVEDKGVPVMCCNQKMAELRANTVDAATEKHVPVLSYQDQVLTAIVGETEHPSTTEHYIGFIIALAGEQILRFDLKPGDKPIARFHLGDYKGMVSVYEYCNLHGLWKADIEIR